MEIKGLNSSEVKLRIKKNLVNFDTTTPSKSIKKIFFDNIFTLFNILNIILGVCILLVKSYKNLLFLGVVFCNTLISIVQEIRAKKIVDDLTVVTAQNIKVIRNGKVESIKINKIVKDDIIIFEAGDQVVVDSKILKGECEVNESFITGEENTIYKKKNDNILSGSFIVSGCVTAKVYHVGLENYISVISKEAKIIDNENSSEIVRSLTKIIKYISIFLIPIGALLIIKQINMPYSLQKKVVSTVAALIGMIPEGLILLTSTVLALASIKLSRKKVLVQDMYSVETFARVDTLCLDKTGTITEGNIEVFDVIPYKNHSINQIDEALSVITTNVNDNNSTFKAVHKKYSDKSKLKSNNIIHFSSERKYSAVRFKDYSYMMGAIEYMFDDYDKYKKIVDEYATNYRVLTVVKTTGNNKNILNDKKEILGFVLLKDKIRKDAKEIINFFNSNDVNLKIITGDNYKTVLKITDDVDFEVSGIYDFSNYNNEDLSDIVRENNVFVRVKPEQKRKIIKALKQNGHTVCMTGDGVNDVLALKEADCSISLKEASSAARNVSKMVLLNSEFSALVDIVKEGRRSINNVERSASLFLTKTIYASLLSVSFIFIKYQYPFEPIHISLINGIAIGFPAFVLALEPNYNRIKGKFLINVLSKALSTALTTYVSIIISIVLSILFRFDMETYSTICTIICCYIGLLLIYKICIPFNRLRICLFSTLIILLFLALSTNIGRFIYSLAILNPTKILVVIFITYISTKLYLIFNKLTNVLLEKKSSWFI